MDDMKRTPTTMRNLLGRRDNFSKLSSYEHIFYIMPMSSLRTWRKIMREYGLLRMHGYKVVTRLFVTC